MSKIDKGRDFGFDTRQVHAGARPDPNTGARAVPIFQTTSFVFEDSESAAAYFDLKEYGNTYSRIMNPTVAAFEERIASLEGGCGAVGFASGMAAQAAALFTMLEPGDHVVSSTVLYGGTMNQFREHLHKMSVEVTWVNPDELDEWRQAVQDNTKLFYGETIGNPSGNVLDIEAVAAIAHEHDIPLMIDNTFASPYLCRPIEWGADIVVESATKFICGHGTSIGGVVVESGQFNWSNGRFPVIAEPSRAYHGLAFHDTFGMYGYLMKLRSETLRDLGGAMSPLNAFLFLQGMETLSVRMDRHVANAKVVAEYLDQHDMVSNVMYPSIEGSKYYALANKYIPKGAGAVFSFELKGGRQAGQDFINGLTLWSHLANVGDTKSLVIHPASTTHRQLSDDELVAAGIGQGTIRLSVGIEHIDDLIWDLDQGFLAVENKDVDNSRDFGFDTRQVHAGAQPDPNTGASVVPIFQTTSFVFEDLESAADYFDLKENGYTYSRLANPTVAAFEERIASLEGGCGAVGFASGMAAQAAALFTMLEPGDHVVSSTVLYGGTMNQFREHLHKMSVEVTWVNPDELDEWRQAVQDNTKLFYGETIGNPSGNVLDIEAVAAIAHEHDIPLMIDNTFASPYLCRPIEWGADIVVESATKFICGHGTSIGGVVVESGQFNWSNGRFPVIAEPSRAYHGLAFHDTFGMYGYLMKLRSETLRDLGGAMSPLNAFLFLQGMETLSVRMDRHVANAKVVAEYLDQHDMVSNVMYPSIEGSKYYALANKYIPKGAGAVFSFELKGGRQAGQDFINGLTLWSHLANVGDTKSLVIHPASTTHRQLSDDELVAAGIGQGTIRLSVGIEHIDDLIWDLDQGFLEVESKDNN